MGWVGARSLTTHPGNTDVSIPERVWGGLELLPLLALALKDVVSIPERVWGGLEPVELLYCCDEADRFNP